MNNPSKKYRLPSLILLVLLFFCHNATSQNQNDTDSINRVEVPITLSKSGNINNFSSLKQAQFVFGNKNNLFYDSLKLRASRNLFTRKLYDFVIVTPRSNNNKRITVLSDNGYTAHSGKKIRSIRIEKVPVFGGSIHNPSTNPNKIENLLNKTHFNTTERIIRKNLLFSENDTISPLELSDNERILRQLSFINDARIIIVPVSDCEVDIVVFTRDVYSLAASYSFDGIDEGVVSVFDKNIFGIGHELGIEIPYDGDTINSPGFGFNYTVDNIGKTFVNLNVNYLGGLGKETFGISLNRNLVSSETKYAGGISVFQMYTTEDLDTLPVPAPLKYNFQDYWLSRSFLLNRESVSRLIFGLRYTNNNIYEKPLILQDSYYKLQTYKIFLASAAFSLQKFYKANLIYSYGRTEDIPYGGLVKVTAGKEINEFKKRTYIGTEISYGKSTRELGYFYASAGFGTYFNGRETEQGQLALSMNYFSNLIYAGTCMIRNFIYLDYSRGFDRYTDELLYYKTDNGFSGFRNDSVNGTQRLSASLESVLFTPGNPYGFKFAVFGFTDFSFLSGSNQLILNHNSLAGIGLGLRIRNDNMVFNTIQIRFTYFPNPPDYSRISPVTISGEQLLKPENFDPGPPSIIRYR